MKFLYKSLKLIAILAFVFLHSLNAYSGEVSVIQASDKTIMIQASSYSAYIDASGNLTELKINGSKSVSQRFIPQGITTINIINRNIVDIRSGTSNIEYLFYEERIIISTAGFDFRFLGENGITQLIHSNGKINKQEGTVDDCRGIVLRNNWAIKFSLPFTAYGNQDKLEFRPFGYNDATIKNSSFRNEWGMFEFTITLADPKKAEPKLSELHLKPIDTGKGNLTQTCNRGSGYDNNFPNPNAIIFSSSQRNISNQKAMIVYNLKVLSHYVCGKELINLSQRVEITPAETKELTWKLHALEPGFYYLVLTSGDSVSGEELSQVKFTFMVDIANYSHQLTKPIDFDAFWIQKMISMRDIPIDAKLKINESKSTDVAIWYDMEFTCSEGKRFKTDLQVPREPGNYIADFSPGKIANKPDRISIRLPINEVENATYQRWNSKNDNNVLDVILLTLRLTDYLRSRPDVQKIFLEGASRGGPIQFINASLDSAKIIGVSIHVPTSAGMGWIDEPYFAWGSAWGAGGDYDPCNLFQRQKFAAMASYFDPVNHAPEMKVPFITSYGIDDALSRPEGIEVMFKLANSSWKAISRDLGGHQYSSGFQELKKELIAFLHLEERLSKK